MSRFLDLWIDDAILKTLQESAEAFGCFMFDKRQLMNNRIELDDSNLNSVGQVCWKFLGFIDAGVDVYIKLDVEVDTFELVFETYRRQFCALVNKHKFITQDEFEWNRLANYWIGLASNSKILKQGFNQSLISLGFPKSLIEWDSTKARSIFDCNGDKYLSEKAFKNFLSQICGAFSLEFKLNLIEPSNWKFRYLSTSKYGYFFCCKTMEIRLLIHLDRLRLSIFSKKINRIWLDLPLESLRDMNQDLHSAIFDSLFLAISD